MASDAAGLSAADSMSGDFDCNFVVRFRGCEDGGSGKVRAAIAAPASWALVAGGAVAVGARRRRV